MKTWRIIRDAGFRWFGISANPDQQSRVALLSEELQALLELSCYAASQTLAFSKLLDYQINALSDSEIPLRPDIAQEYVAVQTELERHRETIALLHNLLNLARTQLALAPARLEREATHRMVAELLEGRELEELKQTIKNLGHNLAGSDS